MPITDGQYVPLTDAEVEARIKNDKNRHTHVETRSPEEIKAAQEKFQRWLDNRPFMGTIVTNTATQEQWLLPSLTALHIFQDSRRAYPDREPWKFSYPKEAELGEWAGCWAYRRSSDVPWGDWDWPDNPFEVSVEEKVAQIIDGVDGAEPVAAPEPPVIISDEFEYVLAPRSEVDEGCFPKGEISLVAGYSGAGKSTWLYDVAEKQLRGETVAGRATYRREVLVIMHDRSRKSLRATFKRMHIDPNTFPYVTLSALEESASYPANVVADKIKACQVKPEVVIVEGFDFWVPDPNKTQIVSPFLAEMREMAEKYDVALVGTVGCPKQKPREQYADLRSKIIGSQAWARRSETIVLVIEGPEDNPKLKLKAGDRQIHILPRNGRAQRLTVAFNDSGPRSGRMDEVVRGGLEVDVTDVKARAQDVFREWTEQREEFTTVSAAEYFDVTLRTIQRWVEELEGWRKLPRKGRSEAVTYRKNDSK